MKQIIIKGIANGKPIDISVSRLLMGSSDFLRADNMDVAHKMIDTYIQNGGNAFDTARHYRYGEAAIKTWLQQSNTPREDIVIFTKGGHPTREHPQQSRVNAACIHEDITKSLEVLDTDYIDLFALHRDDPSVSVGEIMIALNEELQAGRVHAIGVSNWELDRIIEANAYARYHNLHPLMFTSPNLSLAKPIKPRWPGCVSADSEMELWHKTVNIPLISWSSQAGGFFSGRFTQDNFSDLELKDSYDSDDNWERYQRCQNIAQLLNKTPIQIALAYILNLDLPVLAAIGCETLEELHSSLEGESILLTQDICDYLNLRRDMYA